MTERFLELTQLGKTYDTPAGPAVVVRDVNLCIREGEFVCIIGHSGCGKSTVLSMVMGLVAPTTGGVILAGKEIDGPGLDRGVVFQAPALLPWLTAHENVRLAVDQVHADERREARAARADGQLERVGLADVRDRHPHELSAGMRQRVGIARALALEPKVLLLDEPFSLLDAVSRMELQSELLRLWERDRKTVVMVTHDVDEALLLADRIVMMTRGPAATIGAVVDVPLPRPRLHATVLQHPAYYPARERLLAFLDDGEASPAAAAQPNDDGAPDAAAAEEETSCDEEPAA
jgi:nitrate ABC transporter ATP-binding subunit